MREDIYRDGKLIESRWMVSLDEHRAQKIAAIDARTAELISQGLPVAPGVRISLSIPAQINLHGIATLKLLGEPYVPQPVSTVDGRRYVIRDQQDFERIVSLMSARIREVYQHGQALRLSVFDARTHEEIERIPDRRE